MKIKPRGKLIRDPVHRLIRIEPGDAFILELIDSPLFQRLRRVRQLGVSNFVYPGADHSRFSHSLGVFNFAQRILFSLKRRYPKNQYAKVANHLEEISPIVKAAALLHDIGHGPYSHVTEHVFDSRDKHEDRTVKIIKDESTGIADILKNADIKANEVAEIIDGTSVYPLAMDIVSSQLDADRMDYLLRDGLATGVEYGKYDAEWLLIAMCLGQNPGETKSEEENWRLCLDESRGLFAAEQFIIARMHMTQQVYMHRVTRGYEVLLISLFRLATRLAEEGSLPNGTPKVVKLYFKQKGELPLDQWEWFDESAMGAAIQAWAIDQDKTVNKTVKELSSLARSFLHRDRVFLSRSLERANRGQQRALERKLKEYGEEQIDWEIDDGGFLPYKGILNAGQGKDQEEKSNESILLSDGEPDHRARPAEIKSGILRNLDDKRDELSRLYYVRSKEKDFQSALKELPKP